MSETLCIPAAGSLDAITVYWHNYELGKGMVTIVYCGCAWNCYFGGMGPTTNVQKFFKQADTCYLVDRLGSTQWLKQSKRHEQYLGRLIEAVKEAIA